MTPGGPEFRPAKPITLAADMTAFQRLLRPETFTVHELYDDYVAMFKPLVRYEGDKLVLTTDLAKARFAAARLAGHSEARAYEEVFLPGVRQSIAERFDCDMSSDSAAPILERHTILVGHQAIFSDDPKAPMKKENLHQFLWQYRVNVPQFSPGRRRNGMMTTVPVIRTVEVEVIMREDGEVTRMQYKSGWF